MRPNKKELCSYCSEVLANSQLMSNSVHFQKSLPAPFTQKTLKKSKLDKWTVKTGKLLKDPYNKMAL